MILTNRRLRALGVFLAALAYFLLFRRYGFQIEDEGTLLFQLDRAARGQLPYSDFHTGYTPGFFAAGAALLRGVGFDVALLRTVLALLHAGVAATLYALAAPLAGPALALVAPAAFVLFLPVWPGDFASFNVPYPAWFANAAWMATAVAMTAFARRGSPAAAFAAGLAAGAAFAIKPNAGAFALAASSWTVAMTASSRSLLDRAAAVAASAAMLAGVWFALGLVVRSIDAAVHLPPCLAIAVLAATRARGALATPSHAGASAAYAALAAGFALPTVAWVVPTLARLGVDAFLREVLLIGSNAAAIYWLAHPVPQLWAAVTVAGAVAVAAGGYLVAAGRLRPAPPLLAASIAVAGSLVALRFVSLAPEGFLPSLLFQLENAAFWIAPVVHLGAVALLARRLARGGRGDDVARLAALVPLAVAMYLQLYPRSDFMHLVMGMPLAVVAGLVLLRRVAAWWTAGDWPAGVSGRGAVAAFAGALAALVLGARLAVNVEPLLAPARRTAVETDRAQLWIEDDAGDDLEAFGRMAREIEARTTAGEEVLPFPSVSGLLFLSARTSPVPHDYWYPERPDHADERRMLARLRSAPPRLVATLNSGWTFFERSPAYFAEARTFVCERYALVARFGRFDLLERRDVPDAGAVLLRQPAGTFDAIAEPRLGARRQAVRRWLAALTPEEAAAAILPGERVRALLVLRALRDAGDLRAAAWIVEGWKSADPRLRNEAVGAMEKVSAAFRAARSRWACDDDVAALRPFVARVARDVAALSQDGDARVRAFAADLQAVFAAYGSSAAESRRLAR